MRLQARLKKLVEIVPRCDGRLQRVVVGEYQFYEADRCRCYPAAKYPRVVLLVDNAPWHRGGLVEVVLAEHHHLELKRLPSYSPQLNVIERFWKLLRRRATHNRLFDKVANLKHSIRDSLRYFQTVRSRLQSLISGCYPSSRKTDKHKRNVN